MRVLWVVKGLGPGGAERLLCAAARRHGHDIEIECVYVLPWKRHLVDELESAGVPTVCVSRRRIDPLWPVRLARVVRSKRFDVVHVHSPLPGSVARLAVRSIGRASRPAVVSTEHNGWSSHRWPTRALNRLTTAWNDATIAVTDDVRSSIRGPAAAQATTLRHGIDLDGAREDVQHRTAVRAELGVDDDEFVVGTVANFRPQKDYGNLLAAARILADRDVAVRVIAIGQGPLEAEIRAVHADLGLGERVLLTGYRHDAVRVLAACDAFTLASAWEGLPVALMEALALGLPIVATAVGGMAEELSDDVDAVLVPPRDAPALAAGIERLARDRALRDRLAAASAARAPEFGIDRTVEHLEAVYARLVRARDSARPADSARARPAPAPATAPAVDTVPRLPRLAPSLELRAATPDDRAGILALLRRSLGDDGDPRYPELFAWKHDHNRFGPSPMWVVTEGDRIAAFRAFLRWEFVCGDRTIRAVRAVDTATDPNDRGRGLFTALTLHGLEELRADGVEFVFNTPNGSSLPGYLKMGWEELGRLPVAVCFAGARGVAQALRSRVPASRWSLETAVGVPVLDWLEGGGFDGRRPVVADDVLHTAVDVDYLAWRFGAPWLGYRVVEDGDTAVIVRRRARGHASELVVAAEFGDAIRTARLAAANVRDSSSSYAIRLGSADVRRHFLPAPGMGPILTWRSLGGVDRPTIEQFGLRLGDIELF